MIGRSYPRDCLHVENVNQKELKVVKDRRKKLRTIRKGFVDKYRENEGGDAYCSGHNFLRVFLCF